MSTSTRNLTFCGRRSSLWEAWMLVRDQSKEWWLQPFSPVEIHELERLELAESISLGPLFSATPPDATFILPSCSLLHKLLFSSKHITSFLQKLIIYCCLVPRPPLQIAFKHFVLVFGTFDCKSVNHLSQPNCRSLWIMQLECNTCSRAFTPACWTWNTVWEWGYVSEVPNLEYGLGMTLC